MPELLAFYKYLYHVNNIVCKLKISVQSAYIKELMHMSCSHINYIKLYINVN